MIRNSPRKSSFSPQLETLEDKRLLTAIDVVPERAYLNANFNAFDHNLDASLNLADVDADGNLDVVIGRRPTGEFGWVPASDDFYNQPVRHFAAEAEFEEIVSQDFTADNQVDFLVRTDQTLVLYEPTSATDVQRHAIWTADAPIRMLPTFDFNTDQLPDLAVLSGVGQITLLKNNGDGSFEVTESIVLPHAVSNIQVRSTDNQLFVGNDDQGQVIQYSISTRGEFADTGAVVASSLAYANTQFVVTDLNGDNQTDLLANSSRGLDWLVWNSASGTFDFQQTLVSDRTFNSIHVLDLNQDGQAELLLEYVRGFNLYVATDDGLGGFEYQRTEPTISVWTSNQTTDTAGTRLLGIASESPHEIVELTVTPESSIVSSPLWKNNTLPPLPLPVEQPLTTNSELVLRAIDGGAVVYSNFVEDNPVGIVIDAPSPELQFERSIILDGTTALVWTGEDDAGRYIRIQANRLEPTLGNKLHQVTIVGTGEFNGDGQTDLLLRVPDDTSALGGGYQVAMRDDQEMWTVQGGLDEELRPDSLLQVRDVNNDGLDDLLRPRFLFDGSTYKVRFSLGNGQFEPAVNLFTSDVSLNNSQQGRVSVADVSGDGIDEWFRYSEGAFRRLEIVGRVPVERQVLPGEQLWTLDVDADLVDDVVVLVGDTYQLFQWDPAANSLAYQQDLPELGSLIDIDGDGVREFTSELNPLWDSLGDFDGDGVLELLRDSSFEYSLAHVVPAAVKLELDSQQSSSIISTGQILLIDLDNDGDQDAAQIDSNGSVWFENTDGRLSNKPILLTDEGLFVYPTEVIDFDGDGDDDIVTVNNVWLENQGNGQIVGRFTQLPSPSGANLLGDLDGDGDADAVGLDTTMSWSENKNTTDGFFQQHEIPNGFLPTHLADFNQDGHLDIIGVYAQQFRYLLNDGDGSFAAAQSIPLDVSSDQVFVSDFDQDGDLDVASVEAGQLTFFRQTDLQFAMTGNTIPIADDDDVFVSEDGDSPTVVVRNSAQVKLYQWNADAWNESGETIEMPNDSISVGDLDQDGQLDVILASQYQMHAFYSSDQLHAGNRIPDDLGRTSAVASADLDGDGTEDTIMATNQGVYWLPGGGFAEPAAWMAISFEATMQIIASDLDNDGDLDLIAEDSELVWYPNQGGSFGSRQVIGAGGFQQLDAVSVDGDALPDVVARQSNQLLMHRNLGNRSFADATTWLTFDSDAESVLMADTNADGLSDVIVHSVTDGLSTLKLYRNVDGALQTSEFALETAESNATLADLDQDSFLDLVLLQRDRIAVAYGDGNGAFLPSQTLFFKDLSISADPMLVDMDHDGDLDIFLANERRYFENIDVWRQTAVPHSVLPSNVLPYRGRIDSLTQVTLQTTANGETNLLLTSPNRSWAYTIDPTYQRLDFNRDALLDSSDVDLLYAEAANHAFDRRHDMRFDLTDDRLVDQADLSELLTAFGTSYGDVDVNGVFDSADLVRLFQVGKYGDPAVLGSTLYSEGDWNLDGRFDSSDLVLAFQFGNYVTDASPAAIGRMAARPLTSSLTKTELAEVANRDERDSIFRAD
ncbi:MAG: VCBS repeat-containing protein [Pirellulaceae bacterium]